MCRKIKAVCFITFSYLIASISGSGIPVLMWTNNGNSHYPVSLSGHTLGTSDFSHGYLDQIIDKADQNIAVFIQDKLSLEDITNYADVYNEKSDGAVFTSVKNILETYESTHLPSVKGPTDALDRLQVKFKGKIHQVKNQEDADNISFEDGVPNLLVVYLRKSDKVNRKEALKQSDELIGRVTRELSEKNKPFSAVYTASESSKSSAPQHLLTGRRLLANQAAAVTNTSNYTYFKYGDCFMFYMEDFIFQVKQGEGEPKKYNFTNLQSETTDMISGTCGNTSAEVNIDYASQLPAGLSKFSMKMNMTVNRGYWMIQNWTLSFAGDNLNGSDVQMDTHNDEIYGTMAYKNPGAKGFSYFCGNQPPIQQYERTPEVTQRVQITFTNFQLQYGAKNETFGPANYCTPVFSGAVWSGIIIMLLMTMILAWGLWMVVNITTMDRFDDPKGKTIQVNVTE